MNRRRQELLGLTILLLGGVVIFCLGIQWGLPSHDVDRYLFGDHPVWTGREILALVGERSADAARGADMDVNPLGYRDRIVWLNETDAQRAEIVLRYRLFTYHPDEMVTMMSLARMRPGQGDFDPRMYQYGGLWVYPVGALLRLAATCRLITLTPDLAHYLDHPEDFGRFYVIARLYAAAWALVGIWAVFRIAHRLTRGSLSAAVTAAACFALMPVVVNGAHEAKPHLPGAVLTLLAVLAGMRCLDKDGRSWWIVSCVLSGAAVGMVLSAWPVVVVPIVLALLAPRIRAARFAKAGVGVIISLAVFLATNPYVFINLLRNRELIRQNLANTRAMFHIGPAGETTANALWLIGEGTSIVLALAGLAGIIALAIRDWRTIRTKPPASPRFVAHWLLAAPAFLSLVQFAVFAHGQGGEYARFAMLVDATLGLAAVVALDAFTRYWNRRTICQIVLLFATAVPGAGYVWAYVRDYLPDTTRNVQAEHLADLQRGGARTLAVDRVPAPYCLPPVNLFEWRICLLPSEGYRLPGDVAPDVLVRVVDRPRQPSHVPSGYTWLPFRHVAWLGDTEMSWADKPFVWLARQATTTNPQEAPIDAP